MDPRENPNSNEYHPKTIFSDPQQGVPPPIPVPPAGVYGTTPAAIQAQSAKASSKKGLMIALGIAGAVVLVLIIIVVVIMASKGSSKKQDTSKQSQAAILQPATEIELEQINNSINQDMSTIDDEKDYPANSLEDKTLGL